MAKTTGYKFYYDKDIDYLHKEELEHRHPFHALRYAKLRLRMYANLFTRGLRKTVLTTDSKCINCEGKEYLQLDHIRPIAKGGKNEADNIQILCKRCNNLKRDKIYGK